MDKSLESFLHPTRKPDLKFSMTGFKEQFEFRQLSAKEGIDIAKFTEKRGIPVGLSMLPNIAAALVKPDLRNKELQDALAERCGHKIMEPYDAMLELFTDSELAKLVQIYSNFVNVTAKFEEDIKEAKNS